MKIETRYTPGQSGADGTVEFRATISIATIPASAPGWPVTFDTYSPPTVLESDWHASIDLAIADLDGTLTDYTLHVAELRRKNLGADAGFTFYER